MRSMADFDGQDSHVIACEFTIHELSEGFRQRVFPQCYFDGDLPVTGRAQVEDFALFDGGSGGCAEPVVIQQKPEKCLGVEQELHAM